MTQVYTASKVGLIEAQLPLYTGARTVRAAMIVAVGLAPTAAMTRLALAGGAHVDVSKAWMQKFGAVAGEYYVQNGGDAPAEPMAADAFESMFSAVQVEAEFGETEAAGQRVDFLAIVRSAGFVEFLKNREDAAAIWEAVNSAFMLAHHGSYRPPVEERSIPVEGTVGAAVGKVTAVDGPSAEDLDKMAEEQAIGDATAGNAGLTGGLPDAPASESEAPAEAAVDTTQAEAQ